MKLSVLMNALVCLGKNVMNCLADLALKHLILVFSKVTDVAKPCAILLSVINNLYLQYVCYVFLSPFSYVTVGQCLILHGFVSCC